MLFAVSAAGLLLSVAAMSLFCPLGPVTDIVRDYRECWPAVDWIFAVFLALMCLCFLLAILLILFLPNRSDTLTFVKGRSLMQFSRKALEATVRYCIRDIPSICAVHVRVKIHRQPEKSKIDVRLTLDDSSELMNLAETCRDTIAESLKSSLGVDIQAIHIKITEFHSGQGGPAKAPEEKPGNARVV